MTFTKDLTRKMRLVVISNQQDQFGLGENLKLTKNQELYTNILQNTKETTLDRQKNRPEKLVQQDRFMCYYYLRRSPENDAKDFVLIIVRNRHDLATGFLVSEENSLRFAL